MSRFVLALDQGTTSSRAIVFSHAGEVISQAQREFRQILPAPGHVEHDADEIWSTQLEVARQALAGAQLSAKDLAAIGITNQRETTVLWEKSTGRPIDHAMVWQSRASAGVCDELKRDGHEQLFRERTGLLIDPYFSGTKIKYLLDKHPGARERAARGEILFGTVDSYLAWRLTGGRLHITDVSNASRTLIFDIHRLDWDDELLRILDIPRAMLPAVQPSSCHYGDVDPECLGAAVPLAGIAGDQQAATFGQACFAEGDAKNTYGTGCFMLLNTGETAVTSANNLLTTVGWGIGDQVTYCLEGSVFIAGAVVQWLRDGLGIIKESRDVEALAAQVPDTDGVIVVPAFVGLGAPYWDPYARGAILGITRGTTAAHIARAAVESMAFQTRDVLEAMRQDAVVALQTLKVDGGAAVNDDLMQFQSDMLGCRVQRPVVSETTALGAAYLAGLAVGFWKDTSDVTANWVVDREFSPTMLEEEREQRYRWWKKAVSRTLDWGRDAVD